MPYWRIQQNMVAGSGETVTVDLFQWNPITGEMTGESLEELERAMQEVCAFADKRMYDLNMRMLNIRHKLRPYFPEEVWGKITQLLEVLAGRLDMETLIARWESIREENEELARNREMHAQRQREEYAHAANEYASTGQAQLISDVHQLGEGSGFIKVVPTDDGGYTAPCGCHVDGEQTISLCEGHKRDPFS